MPQNRRSTRTLSQTLQIGTEVASVQLSLTAEKRDGYYIALRSSDIMFTYMMCSLTPQQ